MERIEAGHENATGGVATPTAGIRCAWRDCWTVITRPRRGQRYCCAACRVAAYDEAHPRLAPPGVASAPRPIKARIKELLEADGRQRSAAQIAYELRVGADTCARELRKLRATGVPVRMARLRGPSKPAVYWLARMGGAK